MGQFIKFSTVHFGFVRKNCGFVLFDSTKLGLEVRFCCINFHFITSKLIASETKRFDYERQEKKKIQYQDKSYANDTCFLGIISLSFYYICAKGKKKIATVSFLRFCFFFWLYTYYHYLPR